MVLRCGDMQGVGTGAFIPVNRGRSRALGRGGVENAKRKRNKDKSLDRDRDVG
jgi:hypothetical protein